MDETPLEVLVGISLREKKKTLALAESCTGGLLGHLITQVPGSSDYLKGGVIAYSYEAKEEILKVQRDVLNQYGAVSEQAAIQMAEGARKLFDADYALAVTGIAGPSSDRSEKPVGLTWLAISSGESTRTETHQWQGSRAENKEHSAQAALELLLDVLEGSG